MIMYPTDLTKPNVNDPEMIIMVRCALREIVQPSL